VLNQVLVAFGSAQETERVIGAAATRRHVLVRPGPCGKGRAAMRISVSSWATTEEDVERSLLAILRSTR
jgi:hypothetical protein